MPIIHVISPKLGLKRECGPLLGPEMIITIIQSLAESGGHLQLQLKAETSGSLERELDAGLVCGHIYIHSHRVHRCEIIPSYWLWAVWSPVMGQRSLCLLESRADSAERGIVPPPLWLTEDSHCDQQKVCLLPTYTPKHSLLWASLTVWASKFLILNSFCLFQNQNSSNMLFLSFASVFFFSSNSWCTQ